MKVIENISAIIEETSWQVLTTAQNQVSTLSKLHMEIEELKKSDGLLQTVQVFKI